MLITFNHITNIITVNIHSKGYFEDYHLQIIKEEIVTQGIHDFPKLQRLVSEGLELNTGLPLSSLSSQLPHWTRSHA